MVHWHGKGDSFSISLFLSRFLGHFQPQEGKPALWELDSDQHHKVGGRGPDLVDEDARYYISS